MDGRQPTDDSPRVSRIAGAVVGCLVLAMLLVSGKLVDIAERQPLGESRDRWLEVAEGMDRASNFLALNRPYDLISEVRGAGADAGERVDTIAAVADRLARQRQLPSAGSPTPSSTASAATETPTATGTPAQTETPRQTQPTTAPESPEEPGPTSDFETPAPVEVPTPAEGLPQATSPYPGGSPAPSGSTPPSEQLGPTGASPDLLIGFNEAGKPLIPLPPADTELLPPAKIRTVGPDHPLRVYVAGDSQAFYPGHALAGAVDGGFLDVTVDSRNGTGLARPDFFNWPAEFLEIVNEHDPELVVLFMGGNDWQAMQSADGLVMIPGSEEWRSEWAWRMHITFDTLVAPHRHVVWVGLPPARPEPFSTGNQLINEISQPVTLVRPDVTMVDIWDLFGGGGDYQESVPPPEGGSPVRARQEDGLHLNRTGSAWVADLVVEVAQARWDFEESG